MNFYAHATHGKEQLQKKREEDEQMLIESLKMKDYLKNITSWSNKTNFIKCKEKTFGNKYKNISNNQNILLQL